MRGRFGRFCGWEKSAARAAPRIRRTRAGSRTPAARRTEKHSVRERTFSVWLFGQLHSTPQRASPLFSFTFARSTSKSYTQWRLMEAASATAAPTTHACARSTTAGGRCGPAVTGVVARAAAQRREEAASTSSSRRFACDRCVGTLLVKIELRASRKDGEWFIGGVLLLLRAVRRFVVPQRQVVPT